MNFTAEETLIYMIDLFKFYLEDIEPLSSKTNQFVYGEKTAYVECLEIIQYWKDADKHGLDASFNIEERYPL